MAEVATNSVLLEPKLMAKLERMELVSRKIFRGRMKGERRSRRKGQSVEFADFRNYSPGDDLRFIDWNLFARLDRLYLKLFLEEEDLHLYILIDDSLSMSFGTPTKLHFAKQLGAALGYIGLCRGDRVSFSTFNHSRAKVYRGRSNAIRMLNEVNVYEPTKPSRDMKSAVKEFCLRNAHKGIVVVISDLMDKDGYESAMRMLVARDLDIFMVHVLSHEELEPDIKGDLKLVDCEDADQREISVSASLLKRYKQTLNGFIDGAKSFCRKRSISYVPAKSDQPLNTLFEAYLQTRGLVR
jgi:uncharacterized protein (DUF58 family)